MDVFRIFLDIDGVIADLATTWFKRYNEDYGDNIQVPEEITEWDTAKIVKPECGQRIFDYLKNPSLYNDVLPYPGAIDFVKGLCRYGRVIYATSTPPESGGTKYLWLKKWEFPHVDRENYIELTDKSLLSGESGILIDDYSGNLRWFTGEKILLARPWSGNYTIHEFCIAESYKQILGWVDLIGR